jgi:hypothetical protein
MLLGACQRIDTKRRWYACVTLALLVTSLAVFMYYYVDASYNIRGYHKDLCTGISIVWARLLVEF